MNPKNNTDIRTSEKHAKVVRSEPLKGAIEGGNLTERLNRTIERNNCTGQEGQTYH